MKWLLASFLLALGGLGCQFFLAEAEPELLGVVEEWPTPTPWPEGTLQWRYVDEGQRLVFEKTPVVPTPTVTPRPTPDFSVRKSRGGTPRPTVARRAGLEFGRFQNVELGCVEAFRARLVGYVGRELFGPEVAWKMSGEFLEERPDCREEGWGPEFSLEAECVGLDVGSVQIGNAFVVWEGAREKSARVLSSRKDEWGNILLHFSRMPLQEGSGCWYYRASDETWVWVVRKGSKVENGVDNPDLSGCDSLLKAELRRLPAGFSLADVGRAVDRVVGVGRGCQTSFWRVFPRLEPDEGCGVDSETGDLGEGGRVVHWHEDYRPYDGAVCWVLERSWGLWKVYGPAEEP